MYEDKLYQLILAPEMTWEGLIRDIVKKEDMDPWDINISALTDKYIELLKKLDMPDFKMSGKMIMSAAILLRMKSELLKPDQLVRAGYYLSDFSGAINLKEIFKTAELIELPEDFQLIPRLNPSRTRKVTIDELVTALNKAMAVQIKREHRWRERDRIQLIKDRFNPSNIGEKIKNLYAKIMIFFKKMKKDEVTFTELNPSKDRKDIIWTFVPLLHLATQEKIRLRQEDTFGEIYVGKNN